jgi:hypothetical protein
MHDVDGDALALVFMLNIRKQNKRKKTKTLRVLKILLLFTWENILSSDENRHLKRNVLLFDSNKPVMRNLCAAEAI